MSRVAIAAIRAVSAAVGAGPGELVGLGRCRRLSRGRWAAMVALRRRGWSLTRIGDALGERDHSTVWYALRRAEALASDAKFMALVAVAEAAASAAQLPRQPPVATVDNGLPSTVPIHLPEARERTGTVAK